MSVCMVDIGGYWGSFSAEDYLQMITAIPAKIYHPGEPCPAEPMQFIAGVAKALYPEDEVFMRIASVPDDGRGCPSGECRNLAMRELKGG